ncbi:MAG: carbohydrate ABC transporter permease [Dorea sp.]|nr:carbohydrate ABC transporter permease [Dorea sp.]MCI9614782.1 carbohydrate ABC transporter permease [Dorea sp.]
MYKLKIKIINGSLNILTGIIVLVSLFPLYWLISTSMKSKAEAFAMPPKWLFMPDFTNYSGLLENVSFLESLKNSLVISVSATILAVTLGVMAGYALARNNSRSGNAMGIGIILARMIPPMGIIIPFYMIFNYLSLTDRYVSVILIYLTTVLPFVTWLMMGFFQGVPAEIEEAALIDGCGRIGTFLRICLPVVKPGIATCAMFAFMMSWNEYFYAVIMTGNSTKTAPIYIQSFVSSSGTNWGSLCAASVLVVLPILIFTIFCQRSLVRGLMGGAVKG